MGTPLLDVLESGRILLSDGAMGTELQRHGLETGECPEEYNRLHPDIVQGIYRAYFEAGSDLIETNTFGGNRKRLQMYGQGDRVDELNRAAVALATEVCPTQGYVAGSVGPTGEVIEPYGTLSTTEARDVFREQIQVLDNAGVDVIFIETMMSLEEALVALGAARSVSALPVAVSMSFEQIPTGARTSWGVDPQSAVRKLSEAGADIIGANCGQGFEGMGKVVEQMRSQYLGYLLAQANAGSPTQIDGDIVYNDSPQTCAMEAKNFIEHHVEIIGGCCGTTPDHIRVLRNIIDANHTPV